MDMAIDPVLRRYAERSSQVSLLSVSLIAPHRPTYFTLLPLCSIFLLRALLQPRIDAHFLTYHGDTRFAKIASDRLREAVVQITGKRTNLALGGSAPNTTSAKRPKTKAKNKSAV